MKGLVTVVFKKDCLDLPDKTYITINIEPSKKTVNQLKVLNRTVVSTVEFLNLAQQLSDGFQYENTPNELTGTYDRSVIEIGSPKDEALKELLDEYGDEDNCRLVIYGAYKATIERITNICLERDWTVLKITGDGYKVFSPNGASPKALYSVNDCLTEMDRSSDTKTIEKLVVVAQADSASTGLEFSSAPAMIYYSNSNNGANRMQSEDRAFSNNMDKNRGLTIYDFVHLPTDKLIIESLKEKKRLQDITMGDVSKIMMEEQDDN
jgi:hypothetical protein